MEPLVQARHQQLEVCVPETPVRVSVDVERLGRVLRNLLGNANKYGPDGGRVAVSLESEPGGVHLTVADDGPGIPAALHERIFERFYRASGGSSQMGSGLGLPIARALVELHGGRVWVDSQPGQGSTFHVRLPATVTR
jgi:signal transduction histidine kinase